MKPLLAVLSVALAAATAGADEVSDLVRQLKSGDVDARRTAAKSLGEAGAGAASAVPALTSALRDGDLYVRRFAAQSLGEIGAGAKSAVPALTALLQKSGERKEVLDAATAALGKIGGGAGSVKALVATLTNAEGDPEVRRQAAETLGKMGADAKRAIPALMSVLKPPKGPPPAGDLRTAAAEALGEIATPSDKQTVTLLTDLSNDKALRRDRALMQAVNDALKKIKGKKS